MASKGGGSPMDSKIEDCNGDRSSLCREVNDNLQVIKESLESYHCPYTVKGHGIQRIGN